MVNNKSIKKKITNNKQLRIQKKIKFLENVLKNISKN